MSSFRWLLFWCCMLSLALNSSSSDDINNSCPHKHPCRCNSSRSGSKVWFKLDCSWLNLTSIPEGIPNATTVLELNDNQLTVLPNKAFAHLKYLLQLNLEENVISEIGSNAFDGLSRLKVLNLGNNRIRRYPRMNSQLRSLEVLHLHGNGLHNISRRSFANFPNVTQLWLNYNNLTQVPVHSLSSLRKLQFLSLGGNKITSIGANSFKNLAQLDDLILNMNSIERIDGRAFDGLNKLKALELNDNKIKIVPSQALKKLKSLEQLKLHNNDILEIINFAFSGLQYLRILSLNGNPNLKKIGHSAFASLPSMTKLSLVDKNLNKFPNLTGTNSLQVLELSSNSIVDVPDNFCNQMTVLLDLKLDFNDLVRIPSLSGCSSLSVLKLDDNNIIDIGDSLKGLPHLKDLTLQRNQIHCIKSSSFEGLESLETLNLAENKIEFIEDFAFSSCTLLRILSLQKNIISKISDFVFAGLESLEVLDIHDNAISYIEPESFAFFKNLRKMDLGNNNFPVLPTKGLRTVKWLSVKGNTVMKDFPSADAFPVIREVQLQYHYHCCKFRRAWASSSDDASQIEPTISDVDPDNGWIWLSDGDEDDNKWYDKLNSTVLSENKWGSQGINPLLLLGHRQNGKEQRDIGAPTDAMVEMIGLEVYPEIIKCTPEPDAFSPCEELMGSWVLRCGVWVVFLLALLGNGSVIFIIIASHKRSKLDVSRFLISNLAFADLMMGIYLGFLATVDASTMGKFEKYALDWQFSAGCQTAGFLAVFSSELSVYTLAVITLERYIAIRHALRVHKRISLRTAAVIMLFGWFFAGVIALLPLCDVSSYSKFSVCLPFETGDSASLAYVTSILVMNITAFAVIVTCYVRIYCSIRGSNAWNSNDSRVAKRMALLVATDFACWAPIVFFSLTAAFGTTLINLQHAKFFSIFVFPLNSCANPFLYAILTSQFKKDCLLVCRRIEVKHDSLKPPTTRRDSRKLSVSAGQRLSSGGSYARDPVGHITAAMTLVSRSLTIVMHRLDEEGEDADVQEFVYGLNGAEDEVELKVIERVTTV